MRKGFLTFMSAVLLMAAFPPGAVARANLAGPATPAAPETTAPGRTDPETAQQPAQLRALWVDAFHPGIKTPEEISKLVGDAKTGGFNTLIVQVRRRGDRYFQRGREPFTQDTAVAPAFDPLDTLIARAHAAGLEVHAWAAVLPVWQWPAPPLSPGHVYNQHGPAAQGRDRWLTYTRRGEATRFLDPGHPEAAAYTVDVLVDLVRKYPVDGLHLDYIRYDGPEYGYNAASVERFNARHRRTGQPDPADPLWSDWRRRQVTQLVRRIYLEALAARPTLKVSAALVAWGEPPSDTRLWTETRPYTDTFQDWRAWLEEGILDLAIPMNYFQEFNPRSRDWYNGWTEWQKDHTYGRQVVSGVGAYMNYLEDTLAQISRALTPSTAGGRLAGTAVYAYAATHLYGNGDYNGPAGQNLPRQPYRYNAETNDWLFRLTTQPAWYYEPALRQQISVQPVFPGSAPVPPLPRLGQPTAGHVVGVALDAQGGPRDGIPVALSGPGLQLYTETDGSGWYGFAHVPPGPYTLQIGYWPLRQTHTIEVEAGRLFRVP